jgi:uncharacterized small protein (DUF1192 family)
MAGQPEQPRLIEYNGVQCGPLHYEGCACHEAKHRERVYALRGRIASLEAEVARLRDALARAVDGLLAAGVLGELLRVRRGEE